MSQVVQQLTNPCVPEMGEADYTLPRSRRTRSQFVQDYAKLIEFMTREKLHEDTRREIVYQAIRMYSGHNNYFDHSSETWISKEAEPLCNSAGKAIEPRTVIKEHIVPISISIEGLWREAQMSEDKLKEILDEATTVCIVSNNENSRLNGAKLKKVMPPVSSKLGKARWARYDHKEVRIPRRRLRPGSEWEIAPSESGGG